MLGRGNKYKKIEKYHRLKQEITDDVESEDQISPSDDFSIRNDDH